MRGRAERIVAVMKGRWVGREREWFAVEGVVTRSERVEERTVVLYKEGGGVVLERDAIVAVMSNIRESRASHEGIILRTPRLVLVMLVGVGRVGNVVPVVASGKWWFGRVFEIEVVGDWLLWGNVVVI